MGLHKYGMVVGNWAEEALGTMVSFPPASDDISHSDDTIHSKIDGNTLSQNVCFALLHQMTFAQMF